MGEKQEILKILIERKKGAQFKDPQEILGYRVYIIVRWLLIGFSLIAAFIAADINSNEFVSSLPGDYRTETNPLKYFMWFVISSAIAYTILYFIDKAIKYMFFYKYFNKKTT